jgi:hypothetical protein
MIDGNDLSRLATNLSGSCGDAGRRLPKAEPIGQDGGMTSDVSRLQRWEDSGATWRVVARSADGLVVALLTCDLGEEVGRLVSADPDLLGYVGDRDHSDDPPPDSDARADHRPRGSG